MLEVLSKNQSLKRTNNKKLLNPSYSPTNIHLFGSHYHYNQSGKFVHCASNSMQLTHQNKRPPSTTELIFSEKMETKDIKKDLFKFYGNIRTASGN